MTESECPMKFKKAHVVNFLSMNLVPEFSMPAFFQHTLRAFITFWHLIRVL